MIEFKAECGHTVRAKDEDAGKVVRCSYCGREAGVPDKSVDSDELGFLFSEVEKTGVYEAQSERDRRRRMRARPTRVPRSAKTKEPFNPFSVALKLCYAGVVIFVLIFVGKSVYPRVRDMFASKPAKPIVKPAVPPPGGAGAGGAPQRVGMGLLSPVLPPGQSGIFVNSVPSIGDAYVTPAGTVEGPLFGSNRVENVFPCGVSHALQPGLYDVFVTVRVSDRNLMKLEGYQELRRRVESGGDGRLLREYFLPDGAVDVSIETPPARPMVIVRKYECQVYERTWSPVIALFLPRLPPQELLKYLPSEPLFGFDEEEVKTELKFHNIATTDRIFLIDMLRRIGVAPYQNPDDEVYRIFAINLTDGSIYSRSDSARTGSGRVSSPGGPFAGGGAVLAATSPPSPRVPEACLEVRGRGR